MKGNSIVFNMICGGALCLLTLPAGALGPLGEEQGVVTGYVVSLQGRTLAISNVPMGSGESSAGGPRVMARSHDGTTRELKGEEARKALQKARQSGSISVEVTEKNGEKRYRVTGPDGVPKEYTEKEFEKLRELMHGSGARTETAKAEDPSGEKPATGASQDKVKVEFTRFETTDNTEMPETLDRGTKIKVHFRTEGERKIATRVESIL